MRPLLLLFLGMIGCSNQPASEELPKTAAIVTTGSVSGDATVSNSVGPREHLQFVRAIIASPILERDLPDRVKGTPYAIDYFCMWRIAPEIFRIVSLYPDNRDAWVALSKVELYSDGEYAGFYSDYEQAAKEEFPLIFFRACPDWESLKQTANDEAIESHTINPN
jgi:hypothetical protein